MSEQNLGVAATPATVPEQSSRQGTPATRYPGAPTGWVGWIVFAGIMMMILGCFHAIAGLVGIFEDKVFLVGPNNLVVHVDYTTWGWVHLIAGIIIACAGAALLAGQTWARVVAVACAFGSAILNIGFLSADPIWSTIMIALDVLVIWAVTVHGREVA
jgi:hypothetical protein